MRAAIIQPEYSRESACSARLFDAELSALDSCDESLDIIVMPEYGDIPAMPDSTETFWECVERYHAPLLERAAQTAKRCGAFVFANGIGDRKNTTFAFNREGELFGKYFKRHLTEGEANGRGLSRDYALHPSSPYIIEAEGIRFAFLTCYDFYFYEAFSSIARQNVDIIIGCSHQRSDTHETSELFSRFAAYNCNAYLLRSSVSMERNSNIGGGSMVVSPSGEVLLNMKSRVGMETVEFDPKQKYYKPAGFGNSPAAHYEYVERGRCPWNYRPAGSAITLPDSIMSYPRLCAQGDTQGLLPAFGAAVAQDVNEITFKAELADSGEAIAVPINRSNCGKAELLSEILRKLSCHVVMNIYIGGENISLIREVVSLVSKYDCERYVYFSSASDKALKLLAENAPQIPTCYCADELDAHAVSAACSLNCRKIQFDESVYSSEGVALAHSKGLLCNMLFGGGKDSVKQYIDSGIDTIIAENYTSALPFFQKTHEKCRDLAPEMHGALV